MTTTPRLPQRHRPAHPAVVERLDRPTIVFVTVCTANRKAILANEACAATILNAWRRADSWLVGRYVIMPDHVHLFCAPTATAVPLQRWVQFWKSCSSRAWPQPSDHPIWQRDFWDRQLRGEDSYAEKWEYVHANPVRHGLAPTPDAWPYAGEINVIRW